MARRFRPTLGLKQFLEQQDDLALVARRDVDELQHNRRCGIEQMGVPGDLIEDGGAVIEFDRSERPGQRKSSHVRVTRGREAIRD